MKAEYKSIEHGSTVVVCKDICEVAYVKAWLKKNDKLPTFLGDSEVYPFCIGTKDGAWTTSMDRALYYKPFEEFISDLTDNDNHMREDCPAINAPCKDYGYQCDRNGEVVTSHCSNLLNLENTEGNCTKNNCPLVNDEPCCKEYSSTPVKGIHHNSKCKNWAMVA